MYVLNVFLVIASIIYWQHFQLFLENKRRISTCMWNKRSSGCRLRKSVGNKTCDGLMTDMGVTPPSTLKFSSQVPSTICLFDQVHIWEFSSPNSNASALFFQTLKSKSTVSKSQVRFKKKITSPKRGVSPSDMIKTTYPLSLSGWVIRSVQQ